ncbi:MAG: AMP-binding protein [Corynebacterium sp.]|nr:AMP-binding protein [Corynebacterium sp.]
MATTSYTAPFTLDTSDITSLVTLLRRRGKQAPDHIAFHIPTTRPDTLARDLTIPQFLDIVDTIATRLIHDGFRPGDHGCIMASTSFDWALAEWAIWRAGGIVVPIYETSPVSVATHIVDTVNAAVLFTDRDCTGDYADLPLPPCGRITFTEDWADFYGDIPTPADAAQLTAIEATTTREDIATIVFTSGTTGLPQGTTLAHRNLIDLPLSVLHTWREVLPETGSTIIFLPLAHIFARCLEIICISGGVRITYLSQPSELISTLPALTPQFLVVVPRVLEKIATAARAAAQKKGLGRLWAAAERAAISWGRACEDADRTGKPLTVSPLLRAQRQLFDTIFYRRIRNLLGGHVDSMMVGAAPLSPELSLLFRGMGIRLMEGYGLTETTAPLTANPPTGIRSGTAGMIIPGTEIRIASDGEILARGIGVTPGYLDEKSNAEAFVDGFFRTGDLGELTEDGYLTITGRAKNVLVTAGGKTVSPARWEAVIESHPLVSHAMMVGDNEPYLSAVLVVDREELSTWTATTGVDIEIPEDALSFEVTHPEVLDSLKTMWEKANAAVARSETVKKISVVAINAQAEATLITPTLKLKRNEAKKLFAPIIARFYGK